MEGYWSAEPAPPVTAGRYEADVLAADLGLSIPGDISLVGYNNTAIASLAPVQLTSVDQAGHTMGLAAARMLIERVEGRRDRAMQTTMTPRLVVRRSTAAPSLP
ncbi:HTH-type transcriptional repressor PurR [Streptomyces cyaneofuscatus]